METQNTKDILIIRLGLRVCGLITLPVPFGPVTRVQLLSATYKHNVQTLFKKQVHIVVYRVTLLTFLFVNSSGQNFDASSYCTCRKMMTLSQASLVYFLRKGLSHVSFWTPSFIRNEVLATPHKLQKYRSMKT